jgi:ribosomal protein S18 acetylase RimI-like enzyme
MRTQLDNPAWWALTGDQRGLGRVGTLAARFHPEVSPFGSFDGRPTESHWNEMAHLNQPGHAVAFISVGEGLHVPTPGWVVSWESAGVQMVSGPALEGASVNDGPADPVVSLGVGDVPEMLALVAEARPGPFSVRTVEFGGYVGVRRNGRLVAMAGQRLRPPGFTEISAVATHPDHRRQGLAEVLVRSVAAGILGRGETPFLHVAAGNDNAIRLYEALGFTIRRTVWFSVVQPRGTDGPPSVTSPP